MAVVGQKISGLTQTSTLQDNDVLLISRSSGGNFANYGLLGSSLASQIELVALSASTIHKPLNPAPGQLLTWNSTTSTWVASGAPISVPSGTNNGDLLIYNKATSTWTTAASSVILAPKDSNPIGTIVMYASAAPPAGWFPCDGRALLRSAYPDLFAAIGTAFTTSTDIRYFNIPDLRGQFVRGWDRMGGTARGVDLNRVFGSSQEDSFEAHAHGLAEVQTQTKTFDLGTNPSYTTSDLVTPTTSNITSKTALSGEGETRPKNVALVYCIKYATNSDLNTFGINANAILQNIPGGYLGDTQTWQSPVRLYNVYYVNTTGRPIFVHITDFGVGSAVIYATVGPPGSTNSTKIIGTLGDGDISTAHISFIVPSGWSYKVDGPISNTPVGYLLPNEFTRTRSWVELR